MIEEDVDICSNSNNKEKIKPKTKTESIILNENFSQNDKFQFTKKELEYLKFISDLSNSNYEQRDMRKSIYNYYIKNNYVTTKQYNRIIFEIKQELQKILIMQENHKGIQIILKEILELNKIDTKMETYSDKNDSDKKKRKKVDLICFHFHPSDNCLNFLTPMIIELKYIKGIRKGSVTAEAFLQLLKYKDRTYNNIRPTTIVEGIFYEPKREDKDHLKAIETSHINSTGFFCKLGLGYLNLNDHNLKIQFGGDNEPKLKIRLMNFPSQKNNINIKKILEKNKEWKKWNYNEDKI